MNGKRYRELFDLKYVIDPNTGKEKRIAVYKGDYYQFPEARREALYGTGLCICALTGFVWGGFLHPLSGYSFYVLPFYLFTILPLMYWVMGLFSCFFIKAQFNQVQKDESVDRIKISSLSMVILSGIALLGEGYFYLCGQGKGFFSLDGGFVYTLILMTTASLCQFIRTKKWHISQIETNDEA